MATLNGLAIGNGLKAIDILRFLRCCWVINFAIVVKSLNFVRQ